MDQHEAESLWLRHSGRRADRVARFATGLANHVFLIEQGRERFVLRAAAPGNREMLRGSLYWLQKLEPLGLPLPRLLASGLDHEQPYLVLDYLEGQDLGAVYQTLTTEQKRGVAADLWKAQRRVSALTADGFGYLSSLEDPNRKRSWKDVVTSHLARSRSWIRESGHFDEDYVDRLEERLPELDDALAAVEPWAFFDDATTKNVLIQDGRFSGLVDLDWLCFGDRLYTIALTRMSLLESGGSLDYINFLSAEEGLTDNRRRLLTFYTMVFCVDFMGGLGMRFNQPEIPIVTGEQKGHLIRLYGQLENELI